MPRPVVDFGEVGSVRAHALVIDGQVRTDPVGKFKGGPGGDSYHVGHASEPECKPIYINQCREIIVTRGNDHISPTSGRTKQRLQSLDVCVRFDCCGGAAEHEPVAGQMPVFDDVTKHGWDCGLKAKVVVARKTAEATAKQQISACRAEAYFNSPCATCTLGVGFGEPHSPKVADLQIESISCYRSVRRFKGRRYVRFRIKVGKLRAYVVQHVSSHRLLQLERAALGCWNFAGTRQY